MLWFLTEVDVENGFCKYSFFIESIPEMVFTITVIVDEKIGNRSNIN